MTDGLLFVSSGDMAADQRYRTALDQAARGDLAGAARVLAQAVELVPRFATAWFALGAIRDNLGDRAGALEAWGRACDADPDDYHGARLQLARLGAGESTPAMTAAYVRRLFDQQAPRFDETLVERLGYRGPAVLLEAVQGVAVRLSRITSMLDLGCGTGLCGTAFRSHVDRLVGVDVAPGMIAQAREKGLYDRLTVLDLQSFLEAEAQACAQYQLVVAADVFVYVNDLVPVALATARVLAPGGLFAFTVEAHAGEQVVLQQTLRYAHGAAHVRMAIAQANLELLCLNHALTRTEKGAPVACLVAVASNSAVTASRSTSNLHVVPDESPGGA